MNVFSARNRIFVVLPATILLCAVSCGRIVGLVESTDPYQTERYRKVSDDWSREARIHRGLEVQLIVSATFKSEAFRTAYAEEYAAAYELTSEKKEQFVADQLKAAQLGHEFVMAAFVPEEKYDDFDRANSVWKLYLVNDKNERVAPVEVRKLRQQEAFSPHFFPYVTPWKSVYTVRFPCSIPGTDRLIIDDDTQAIKLVIRGVLGAAEMDWNLK
jgi:hypothetical protein